MNLVRPKVLLLSSESPHSGGASAIVLQRLFRDYPADRLLVLTSTPPPADSSRLGCRYEVVRLAADRLNRTRFWSWRLALRAWGAPDLASLRGFRNALGEFRPEVAVLLMQDSWYYDLAARFARQLRVPLVLLIHDLPGGFEPVPGFLRPRQHHRDQQVYRRASVRLCISPAMADFLQKDFGAPGGVLLPPAADTPVRQPPEAAGQLKIPGRLTLGYAGGLHYGYGEQLLAMLPALRATGTRLEMFGPKPAGSVAGLGDATDVLRFHGRLPPEAAYQQMLGLCDAVLQPYLHPAGTHELQYRTHFPSKLGDCLALGLPLLITGPADAAGVAWCRQAGQTALHVSEPGAAPLESALLALRDDPSLRVSLARRAQAAAPTFAPEVLRAQLHEVLRSAASTSPA